MLPNLKLVVFDMSGTTVKDYGEVLNNFYDALVVTGIPTDKTMINTMMGWSKIEVFEKLWREKLRKNGSQNEEEVRLKAQESFRVFSVLLENWYEDNPIEPTIGCLEIFEYLREKGVKIALNTGFYRRVADIIFHKLNWKQGKTFDFSVTSDEVLRGRPAPQMIHEAMAFFNIDNPNQVAKIGDTPSDLQEGRAAGVHTFGLTNGTHTRVELVGFDNDGLFDSLVDFQVFLKEKEAQRV